MSEAITSKYNEEVELTLLLRNKSNKPGGRILATVRLEELPPAKDIEILIPDSFSNGEFRLSRIVGYGLPQADILTKSDPYVTLQLPNGSEYVTNTLINSGATGIWDALDCSFQLTRQQLIDGVIDVTVKDKGFIGDNILAVGTVAIRRVGIKPGSEIELSIDLKSPKKGSSKGCGRLILTCSVIDMVAVAAEKPDPSFVFGKLSITKIRTFNLKNTEWFGKQVDILTRLLIHLPTHSLAYSLIYTLTHCLTHSYLLTHSGSLLQSNRWFLGGKDSHGR